MRTARAASAIATVSALVTLLLASPSPAAGEAQHQRTFSLAIHVAREANAPVQSDAWIDAQIARAEALFGPVGVHFKRANARAVPDALTHLETRADRDALATDLDKGKINVLVVGSLRDVDEPDRMRQGVHWRPAATPNKHYVIVAATAGATTLAHELGHFFGNPHTTIKDNLMSYDRSGAEVSLNDAQKKKIAIFAGIYARSKELVAE
jgi:hypothetical protein